MIEPKNPPRPEEKWARVKKDMQPFADRIKRTVDSTKESLINNGIHASTIENLIAAGFDMGQESMKQKMDELKSMYGTPVGEPMTIGIASPVVMKTVDLWEWNGLDEEFEGTIYWHKVSGLVEPAIAAKGGSCFSLMRKDHEFASNNIGATVKVKAVKEYYFTVEIVHS